MQRLVDSTLYTFSLQVAVLPCNFKCQDDLLSRGLRVAQHTISNKALQRVLDFMMSACVQLAVETVYLEVTLQLVSKTSSSLSSSQAKALEDLIFDWVLHAEKFVDSRFLDLMKARAKVKVHARSAWPHHK